MSACIVSNEPSTPRAKEHFDAITSMSQTAAKYGFQESAIKKDCEIALDCTSNDEYIYFATEVENLDGAITDTEICESIFQFAEDVGFDFWRRNDRDPSLEVSDVTSAKSGVVSCTQTLSGEMEPSPGFVIHGRIEGHGNSIAYFMQLSAYKNANRFNTYSVMIHTGENPWPIPQTSASQ